INRYSLSFPFCGNISTNHNMTSENKLESFAVMTKITYTFLYRKNIFVITSTFRIGDQNELEKTACSYIYPCHWRGCFRLYSESCKRVSFNKRAIQYIEITTWITCSYCFSNSLDWTVHDNGDCAPSCLRRKKAFKCRKYFLLLTTRIKHVMVILIFWFKITWNSFNRMFYFFIHHIINDV